jgi:hypothetical protein
MLHCRCRCHCRQRRCAELAAAVAASTASTAAAEPPTPQRCAAWMMAFYEGNDNQRILIFCLFYLVGIMFDLSGSNNTRNKTHTHT